MAPTKQLMEEQKRGRLLTPRGQLRVLREFTAALAEANDIDEVLQTLANCTQSVLDWDDCVIYLLSGPRRLIQRTAFGAKSPDSASILGPMELDFGVGIVGAAAQSGTSQLVPDTRLDDRYVLDDQPRLSELAVPLICDGNVVGVIDSEHRLAGFFTADDQALMEDISRIASVRVKAALTLEQVAHDRRAIDQLSESDVLTGLGNRQMFEASEQRAVEAAEVFSVAILDIDRFKLLNDRLGHQQGDDVLTLLANILSLRLASDRTTICRLGGDEFGVMCTDLDAMMFAEQLHLVRSDLTGSVLAAKLAAHELSLSIGMATGARANVWSAASDALLVAKSHGGNTLVRLDDDFSQTAALREDRRWAELITRGIENNQLFLMGQPVQSLAHPDAAPVYHEMLLRYRADNGDVHTPDQFLDSATRSGMLERIDGWVIRSTVEWLGQHPLQTASLNVTPTSMINGFAFACTSDALVDFGVHPSRLILEVTEHAAIEDPHAFRRSVEAIRERGLRIAMDDLGSGWSSLASIRETPVDIVKIDGGWVKETVTDPVARCAVRSMVDCAHLLGASVVAEWIEDEPTLRLMQEMGVECGQGWFFSAARPLEEITANDDTERLAA